MVEWDAKGFESLLRRMGKERIEGARAVILLEVFKVGFPCPFFISIFILDLKRGEESFVELISHFGRCKRAVGLACLY